MRLTDEFSISTPPDAAFAALLDLELVAPCVPGAELGTMANDGSYPGTVSVKLGPMKFVYKGTLRSRERLDLRGPPSSWARGARPAAPIRPRSAP